MHKVHDKKGNNGSYGYILNDISLFYDLFLLVLSFMFCSATYQ